VLVRIIVLLLAVLVVTGNAAEVCASPDVTSMLEEAPTPDPLILPVEVMVPGPSLQVPVRSDVPPVDSRGRRYAMFVFRPPRLFASR
jgi:hypothetical protein